MGVSAYGWRNSSQGGQGERKAVFDKKVGAGYREITENCSLTIFMHTYTYSWILKKNSQYLKNFKVHFLKDLSTLTKSSVRKAEI